MVFGAGWYKRWRQGDKGGRGFKGQGGRLIYVHDAWAGCMSSAAVRYGKVES